MIAIVDYGLGNVGSIRNMLKALGKESVLTQAPSELNAASHIILPGVGHFDSGMRNLRSRGLVAPLDGE